jgi:hypothetical protein
MEEHPGPNAVYSASVIKPFGHIATYDYDGHYLTWVMNGYGGRVQEISGRFSASRDRGVLRPKAQSEVPDLTYLRFALEPGFMAAAVGRRVDGRLNEYTKLYPESALDVLIRVPLTASGSLDYSHMKSVGSSLRRLENRQLEVQRARDALARATVAFQLNGPTVEVGLDDPDVFGLSIGKRVLRSEHVSDGVPVYSANPLRPFGFVESSMLDEFEQPSLLWGIDGNFEWNFIPAGVEFSTTDHCGRLQIKDERIDPEYVWAYLKFTRARYGFDRVFRASLRNVKELLSVRLPANTAGEPLISIQSSAAAEFKKRERAQAESLSALEDVLRARMTVEL